MSNYNLSEGLEDHFDFSVELGGKVHKYSMKYPSTKELAPIRLGYSRLEDLSKEFERETDPNKQDVIKKEVEKLSTEMSDSFTKLFTCEEGSMPIAELLEELPSNMRANFDKMIQKELGNGEAR